MDDLKNQKHDDDKPNGSEPWNFNDNSKPELTPKISPVKAGLLGLAGGFFFYQIFGGLLTVLIFGLNLEKADANALRLITMAGQVLFILLPALIFSKIIYEDVTRVIRFRTAPWIEIAMFTVGIIALTPILQNYLYIQNYFFEQLAKQSGFIQAIKESLDSLDKLVEHSYGSLLKINSTMDGAIVIAVVAITPAVCEEVMFRGYIQKSFELKYKSFFGALITAIFFGLYHFNPYAFLPLTLLGFYLGYSAYKSNSILVPVILHFINNLSAVVLYMVLGESELEQSKAITQAELTPTLIALSYQIILFSIILLGIQYYYRKKKRTASALSQ
ncbi:MAG: CPBP family intramembrane metalloprotease [Ignavibacteriaceae bacterium]|nr:CPBP family intramembrane metalloprotease [Ignavibacteriaceae bacterium]